METNFVAPQATSAPLLQTESTQNFYLLFLEAEEAGVTLFAVAEDLRRELGGHWTTLLIERTDEVRIARQRIQDWRAFSAPLLAELSRLGLSAAENGDLTEMTIFLTERADDFERVDALEGEVQKCLRELFNYFVERGADPERLGM